MEERLQKILSSCGVTSRRQGEQWIMEGRVTVNKVVARLGDKADLQVDEICVDHKVITAPEKFVYFMLHKPRGYVTTLADEQGRKTVADLMEGCGTRVWPVGRLDYYSEGLLIMTNDGVLTHMLTHPSHQIEKEYLVRVEGLTETALAQLSQPLTLDGEVLAPAKVKKLGAQTLSIVIHQGKNRQVRRMCALVGMKVHRLTRVREGRLYLDKTLDEGAFRMLTPQEVVQLQKE